VHCGHGPEKLLQNASSSGERRRPPRRRQGEPPHPIDVHVGSRVRLRRNTLGLSQKKLGEAIGLSYQQVQKYERGATRISASQLFEFASLLNVPIAFFFGPVDPVWAELADDPLRQPEVTELADAYDTIADPAAQRRLIDLARALALDGRNEPLIGSRRRQVTRREEVTRMALRALLAVVDLADEGPIDDDHYQAAKRNARRALAASGERRPK
jgi:transcriptional regulator with XRE-family HTH domain